MEEVSKKFKRFADLECSDSSAVYKGLSLNVANDLELLTVASFAQHSLKQDLFVIFIEMGVKAKPLVDISFFERGIKTSQSLAYCSPYGDWIEWFVNDTNQDS